jgi:hypothetical protein
MGNQHGEEDRNVAEIIASLATEPIPAAEMQNKRQKTASASTPQADE